MVLSPRHVYSTPGTRFIYDDCLALLATHQDREDNHEDQKNAWAGLWRKLTQKELPHPTVLAISGVGAYACIHAHDHTSVVHANSSNKGTKPALPLLMPHLCSSAFDVVDRFSVVGRSYRPRTTRGVKDTEYSHSRLRRVVKGHPLRSCIMVHENRGCTRLKSQDPVGG